MQANKVLKRPVVWVSVLGLVAASASVIGAFYSSLSPYLDFLGQFALQGTIGAAFIAGVLFLLGRHALGSASLAVFALGCIAVAPKAAIQPCQNLATHRALFLNIWAHNPDLANSVQFLANSKADTIIVAEIDPQFLPALDQLRRKYPYVVECPRDPHVCDFSAYSRIPLAAWSNAPGLNMLGLTVNYPDGQLNLIGVHFARPWPFNDANKQMNETDRISRAIAQAQGPRLVMGDFNAVTWGKVVRTMTKLATVVPLPSTGTWRTNFPWPLRVPIDQTLVGPGIACAAKTVGPRVSSDHRPVWIDFAFTPRIASGN